METLGTIYFCLGFVLVMFYFQVYFQRLGAKKVQSIKVLIEKTNKEGVVFLVNDNKVVCVMLTPEKYEELYDLANIVLDPDALLEHADFVKDLTRQEGV